MNLRIKHIVSSSTVVLAAAAMLAPGAQARMLVGSTTFSTGGAGQLHSEPAADRFGRDFPVAASGLNHGAGVVENDRLTRDFPTRTPEVGGLTASRAAEAARSFPVSSTAKVQPVTPVAITGSGSGVDWTAAGIGGALAGLMLILIVLAASVTVRGSRKGSLAT